MFVEGKGLRRRRRRRERATGLGTEQEEARVNPSSQCLADLVSES